MFNEILLLSLSLNATPDTPVDTTTYKKVDLGEVVVTDYKQNRRNLTTTPDLVAEKCVGKKL